MDEQLATQLQIARTNGEKERKLFELNLKFVKNTDDLETAIHEVVDSWLDQ